MTECERKDHFVNKAYGPKREDSFVIVKNQSVSSLPILLSFPISIASKSKRTTSKDLSVRQKNNPSRQFPQYETCH